MMAYLELTKLFSPLEKGAKSVRGKKILFAQEHRSRLSIQVYRTITRLQCQL